MKSRRNLATEGLQRTRRRGDAHPVFCLVVLLFVSLAATPAALAQVIVSVAATDADAGESPANNGEFTVSRVGGNLLQPATVSYTVSGTAQAGADYAALSGSVTLATFQSEAAIPVNVTGNDGLFEGDEFVTITLLPGSGVTVTNPTATVDIADTPHAVTAATGANADEDPVTPGQVIVSLGGRNESGAAVEVDYEVAGSATQGTDYATLPGSVSIPAGSTTAPIAVTPIADDLIEGDETVEITLTGTSDPRAPVGDPASAVVSIEDDDAVADDDGDGLANIDECPDPVQCRDTDEDEVPDFQDPDDDGDGIPTASENAPDQDTNDDGIPDYLDNDDDGDGRPTRDEDLDEDGDGNPATNPTDLDDDGVPDYLDPDDQGGPTGDLDGDGLTNEREEELGTDPQNPDTDGDGVGDGEEDDAGSDPLDHNSFADADGDLVPDAVEVSDGTDPNDPQSFIDSDGGGTGDHIETISYQSHGITPTDVMQGSDDRRDFDGDGLPDRLEISIPSAPDDSDSPTAGGAADDNGNGVTNAVEAWLASLGIAAVDKFSDFDRDGFPDVAEVALGLNPLNATERDTDGDGVPDVIEFLAGADIGPDTDSDADGVPDAREIGMQSDPLDANSPIANGGLDDDGDGVTNAVEQALQALGLSGGIDQASDADGDGIPDAAEIALGTDPLHDEQPLPWIELAQADIGPVTALSTSGGAATASAVIGGHQSGSLAYDWSGTDNAVLAVVSGSQAAKTLAFSPATLPPGVYKLVLRVQRTAGEYTSPENVTEFPLSVLQDASAADIVDSDNDGVPDASDNFDGRMGYANVLQAQGSAVIEANAGVRLQVGSTARISQANSSRVTREDIAAAGNGSGGSVGNTEDAFDYLSGIYDFEVTNLPGPGSAVQVVIPLAAPVGEFAEYRKFLPARGWGKFAEDASNRIDSAAASGGECPAPGDDGWQPGLVAGHSCVQLSIDDGGPNDADGEANGTIRDPGGIGTPKGEVGVGQGSGSVGPAGLFVLGLFLLTAAGRHRLSARAVPVIALFGMLLLATPPGVRADAFVGVGGGVSFLDPETGNTPFSVVDDQDTGYKVFAGFDITPVSRNLSVEAFWADLGQARLTGNGRVDYSLYGAGLSYGIGSVRAPRLSGFLEVGVAQLDAKANLPFIQEDETLMFFGIAGSFAIRRHWFLQLEYEYFAEDAQFVSLSIVKRFRTRSASDARTMPLPRR